MDTLGIEPRASRMLSGCDTTTPCALGRQRCQFHMRATLCPRPRMLPSICWNVKRTYKRIISSHAQASVEAPPCFSLIDPFSLLCFLPLVFECGLEPVLKFNIYISIYLYIYIFNSACTVTHRVPCIRRLVLQWQRASAFSLIFQAHCPFHRALHACAFLVIADRRGWIMCASCMGGPHIRLQIRSLEFEGLCLHPCHMIFYR